MPCPSHWYQPLVKTCFTFLSFFIQTEDIFLCIWYIESFIATFFYMYVHIFMFYAPKWVIPSIILLSTLVLFLWRFPQVWMFHIHIYIESTSTIFIFMLFLKPPPTISVLPLAWTVLCSCFNSFIHMCIHCLGHFNLLLWVPPSPPFLPCFQSEPVLPFFPILLKRDTSNNKTKWFC
jgi:hypothetical protein